MFVFMSVFSHVFVRPKTFNRNGNRNREGFHR